jgi:hypothetical protein
LQRPLAEFTSSPLSWGNIDDTQSFYVLLFYIFLFYILLFYICHCVCLLRLRYCTFLGYTLVRRCCPFSLTESADHACIAYNFCPLRLPLE